MKLVRIAFLLGVPGLILLLLGDRPEFLVMAAVAFGMIAPIIGSTAPEWRRSMLLGQPVAPEHALAKPYGKMVVLSVLVSLALTVLLMILLRSHGLSVFGFAQLWLTVSIFWGSVIGLLLLVALQRRQQQTPRP